jgi:hypothetical protein
VPADAKIHAHACAVDDTLVLRGELKVHVPHAPKP